MANLTIKNEESPLSPIVVTEINREIGNNSCENSWLNFKLTGHGTYTISLQSFIAPGNGYVRLSSNDNVIVNNGNTTSMFQFNPGWSLPAGGSHSSTDELTINVNGEVNLLLEVSASEICADEMGNQYPLFCWMGSGPFSSPYARGVIYHNGVEVFNIANIKKLSPCDAISSQ